MLPFSNLSLFFAAALALVLTPGPAVLYIVTRSVDQGRRAGLVSVLGIEIGNLFHVFAAALGVSALLLSSALAFEIVKYLGAAYLIYIGVRKLMTPAHALDVSVVKEKNLRRVFTQGVVVAVLNPKTALFFLAFLPQFVDSSRGQMPLQTLLLGLMFVEHGDRHAIAATRCWPGRRGTGSRPAAGICVFSATSAAVYTLAWAFSSSFAWEKR